MYEVIPYTLTPIISPLFETPRAACQYALTLCDETEAPVVVRTAGPAHRCIASFFPEAPYRALNYDHHEMLP